MKTDLDSVEAGLARARALPDDAPQKATLINHWAGEIKLIRVNMFEDRKANKRMRRFMRARRNQGAAV